MVDRMVAEQKDMHIPTELIPKCPACSKPILFLEFGVGYNTPGIIKYPFWQMTAQNSEAVYACLNYGEAVCPQEIRKAENPVKSRLSELFLASPARFERAAFRLGGERSILLSYGDIYKTLIEPNLNDFNDLLIR